MDYSKYRQKYINFIDDYGYDDTKFKDHYIFEILYALELNLILWSDIPPNFDELYDLPHTMDYGVDLIDLEYTKTGQVKKYGETSCITWSALCKFYTYSTQVLDINTLILATTEDSKIDNLGNKKLIETNKIQLIRNDFDKLLQKYNNTQHEKEPVITYEIEKRHYLLDCYNLIKNTDKNILNLQLPCGTGKSYIMLYTILETLKTNPEDKFIIFCPWKNLAKQFKRLLKKFNLKISFIGDGKHEIKSKSNVVICINPSVQHIKDIEFKYKFIDEAHHLEDKDSERKPQINKIKAEKEINFSATFHNQDELDYKYPMNQAIEEGYISDYKLHIEYFTSGDKINSLIELIKDNIDWIPIFIYFNDTEKCTKFADLLNQNEISSDYLIGTDNVIKRNEIRENIENGALKVLCLCGMYNEGISIDNLQTVIFGDLRHSQINKIQIAMRANRLYKEKPYYRVVLPIIESDFNDKDISQLIRTFAIIDPRIKEAIKRKSSTRIQIRLDDKTNLEDAKLLYEQIYDRIGKMTNGLSQEEKVNELLDYVKIQNELPKHNISTSKIEFSNGQSMSDFWMSCKNCSRCNNELYSKLLTNKLLKEDYERYERYQQLPKLTTDDKINILLKKIETNKEIIRDKNKDKFEDNTQIHRFWSRCKLNLFNDYKKYIKIYSRLLENKFLKNNYEQYKLKKRNSIWKTDEFLKFIEEHKFIPYNYQKEFNFSDNTNMGSFWIRCKERSKCNEEPYSKLLENKLLKENYEQYKITYKDKPKQISPKNKVNELLKIMEERNTLILQKENLKFSDDVGIHEFWRTCKKNLKCEKEPYSKLLENELLKDNYDNFYKDNRIEVKKKNLPIDKKVDKLLEKVNNLNSLIPYDKNYKLSGDFDFNMYDFWMDMKRNKKCDEKPYSKLLENDILKKDYERYKNKKNLSLEEKIDELLEIMKKRITLIPSNNKELQFSDGVNAYLFWNRNKVKCNEEPYSKLLENKLLKKNYEQYKKEKELTPEKKIDKLLEIINKRNSLISYSERKNFKFSNNTSIYNFWKGCKKSFLCDKEPHSKLLENELLKEDYEQYKKNKYTLPKLTTDDKINILLKKIETNKEIIRDRNKDKFEDNTLITRFWSRCKLNLFNKKNIKIYSRLLENELLKKDYEKYKNKKIKKNLSLEEKIDELLEIMKKINGLIPYSKRNNLKFSDGTDMYGFWGDCKYKKKCEKETYSKLLENELLKEDYEQYKRNNTNTE